MEKNYSNPEFDKYRQWIREARKNGKNWEDIKFGTRKNETELKKFLEYQEETNFWKIDVKDWFELVRLQKEAEDRTKEIDALSGQAIIKGEGEDSAAEFSLDKHSAWQLYKQNLKKNGFKDSVIGEIERASIKILKRLSSDTTKIQPIKGLVIGNVQSGKTANMAALMAMAADSGWNMFVVLSGTIENLRQQTQNRLLDDLNHPGNLVWFGLEHLSKNNVILGQRAQDLHFEQDAKQRYFTVCLKNPSRLAGLIDWLQADPKKQSQMKVLIIDDEADQAGINTADIEKAAATRINNLIKCLVNGRNSKSEDIEAKYKAMNYIGYTATPYANVLNEIAPDSLYPKNFIATLSVSREYFGPQQIFGLNGANDFFEGLDIVNIIDKDDLKVIKDIHAGAIKEIPKSLQNALYWFICGTACMRIWGYKKPISMLIHTSQKTDCHKNIAAAITIWIKGNFSIKECEEVWKKQTEKFSFDKFKEEYPNFDRADEEINKYPSFSEIKDTIFELTKHNVTNIPLDDQGDLVYHEGIHMCIDNCKNNGIVDDMYVRLAYPTNDKILEKAPAFIVVGGATLSRGLTIEGLISTYFLRSVSQADTLMQMGRWFGYRKGYELLPRLWITSKTEDQFKFLSELDQELRDEIREMESLGKVPALYGPKIKNSPKASFIKITSKNKMQSAAPAEMDYSGMFNQTYLFDNNVKELKENLSLTFDFINSLGETSKNDEKNPCSKNACVWRNVDFQKIRKFIEGYKFNSRMGVFNDINTLVEWIEKVSANGGLGNWNVVIGGNSNNKNSSCKLSLVEFNKVTRSRKNIDDPIINIGVLSDPKDIVADVETINLSEEMKERLNNFKSKEAKIIRNAAGLDTTPQLLIYIVDKNSKASINSSSRKDLDAVEDVAGICINIPGGKSGANYVEKISIRLKNNLFSDNGDLEVPDGN